jgi:hypothetical protein
LRIGDSSVNTLDGIAFGKRPSKMKIEEKYRDVLITVTAIQKMVGWVGEVDVEAIVKRAFATNPIYKYIKKHANY